MVFAIELNGQFGILESLGIFSLRLSPFFTRQSFIVRSQRLGLRQAALGAKSDTPVVVSARTARIDLGRPFEALDGEGIISLPHLPVHLPASVVVVGHPRLGILGPRV